MRSCHFEPDSEAVERISMYYHYCNHTCTASTSFVHLAPLVVKRE
jgi:hypothetical protein